MNTLSDRLFDTLVDTNKIYVSMKDSFALREYTNQEGKSPVILIITGNRERERISLDINVATKDWNRGKQRLNPINTENQDINLILDNIKSKLTSIKTSYKLAERVLTPAVLKKEFLNGMPRVRFTAFYAMALEEEKVFMKPGSYNRYNSVLKKLKAFDDEVTFMDIDQDWFKKYKKHCLTMGNAKTTIAGNMAAIKKFLALAVKSGIKLKVNLDEVKAGSSKGNRTSLAGYEIKKLAEFYFSPYINESFRLILGYFLFSCMTGLRISDVQSLTRKNLVDGFVNFISTKTNKTQTIALNETAKKIIEHDKSLFVKKFADQHINDELKKIMKIVGITKIVTFHVARHSFATNFLLAGGKAEKLQRLLGHSSLTQTMVYVHIVEQDANQEIHLLDSLF